MYLVLWVRHFLEGQGYNVCDNVIHQDNQSAMHLEQNGRRSSTKNTRHIEIRYFFITDNIKRNKVSVKYCPTDDLIGDYFTKPVQGSKFRRFRRFIMRIRTGPSVRTTGVCWIIGRIIWRIYRIHHILRIWHIRRIWRVWPTLMCQPFYLRINISKGRIGHYDWPNSRPNSRPKTRIRIKEAQLTLFD